MIKAIVNGTIVLPDAEVKSRALLFDERILGVTDADTAIAMADEVIDAQGLTVAPGLIDVHIHGYLGADTSDADPEGVRRIARGILQNGVTAFLPTTMTVEWNTLERVFDQLRALKAESEQKGFSGAQILGCHAEGPFINPSKKGAQAGENILPPDAEKVLPYQDIIRLLTFAPEMPGGMAFAREIRRKTDIRLSIGHTDATFEQAFDCLQSGADHITHTFNAMTPLIHRTPGVVGAALSTNAYSELIADTFHVSKGLFGMVARLKGEYLVLITDCTRAGGLEDGEYTLGGQPIFVKGIECRLADGTIAGSVLRLNDAVRNLRDEGGLSLREAINAASLNAARSIGVDGQKGSLSVGKDADIILLDEKCAVHSTFVRGERLYNA